MPMLTISPNIGSALRETHMTALAKIKWNVEPINIKIGLRMRGRIERCVALAAAHAAESMPYQPSPSVPGDFPSRWNENLAESITYDVSGMLFTLRGRFGVLYTHAADGTYLIYALYLETGTVKMLPRPWIALTLDEIWDDWQRILGGSAGPDLSNVQMSFEVA